MGAEGAPRVEVEGVAAAVSETDLEVVLVGDEPRLRALVDGLGPGRGRDRIHLRHASEVIEMSDPPAIVVKHKKQSSMRICFDLCKTGDVDAVVSAGNSGAMMACGLFVLGRLGGVERPAIVTTFPTRTGQCALLDMGANVDPRPTVLAQFAVLGSVYARLLHRKTRPRVGLLSNGAEETKGTALTRGAHHLLCRSLEPLGAAASPSAKGAGEPASSARAEFDYLGYVEGRDIFKGAADVVVTDGFTGNVLLKGLEGLAEAVFQMVREEVERGSVTEKLGAYLMRPALRRFRRRTDYAETGGAPLLGVEGVALICHGGSDAKAIKNAILVARDFAQVAFQQELTRAVATHSYLWEDLPPKASSTGGLTL
jgi:glycerol-3-phosphate acyltransferase PlsX